MNRHERLSAERSVLRSLGFSELQIPVCLGYSSLCWGHVSRGESLDPSKIPRLQELANTPQDSLSDSDRKEMDDMFILLWGGLLISVLTAAGLYETPVRTLQ